jgi:hypothetical protein
MLCGVDCYCHGVEGLWVSWELEGGATATKKEQTEQYSSGRSTSRCLPNAETLSGSVGDRSKMLKGEIPWKVDDGCWVDDASRQDWRKTGHG